MKNKGEEEGASALLGSSRWLALGVALIVLVVAGMTASYLSRPHSNAAKSDTVRARVNGAAITQQDVNCYIYLCPTRSGDTLNTHDDMPNASEIEAASLQAVIDRQLLAQKAKKRNITVSNKDIASAYDELVASFPAVSDYEQMRKTAGATQQEVKDMLAETLAIDALTKSLVPDSSASIAKLQAFYNVNKNSYAETGGFEGNEKQVRADYLNDARSTAINKLIAQLRKSADIKR